MDYIVVAFAALVVSALALYSGFGLGTLLMPVFALFFPIPIAVASTAVVHMANNVFRVIFAGRGADWKVVVAFGIPASVLAIPGALFLLQVAEISPLTTYEIRGGTFEITTIKLAVAGLILAFAAFELLPSLNRREFPRKWMPLGGALSGFFGGLSGHQGALRSAVLAKAGLNSSEFVGTVSVCAFMVDISRLSVYGIAFLADDFSRISTGNNIALVGIATLAACLGTYASSKFLKQVTMRTIRRIVGVMLVSIGFALAVGLV